MKMKALLKINETIVPSPSHYHGLYIRPYQSNFLFDIPGFQSSNARVSHAKLHLFLLLFYYYVLLLLLLLRTSQ